MLTVGAVLLAGFVVAAPAGSAASPTPTEKKLQAQMATLQKQVKALPALQKQVKTLKTQVTQLQGIVAGSLAINICATALTADALQGTWAAINTLSPSAPPFVAESAVNDTGACTAAKVTRQTTGVPNLTGFKALLSIFASFG